MDMTKNVSTQPKIDSMFLQLSDSKIQQQVKVLFTHEPRRAAGAHAELVRHIYA
jgi:hypothetical protein